MLYVCVADSSQGTLLLVDASQGVQAQTVANFYLAFEREIAIIPVINKIDLPTYARNCSLQCDVPATTLPYHCASCVFVVISLMWSVFSSTIFNLSINFLHIHIEACIAVL